MLVHRSSPCAGHYTCPCWTLWGSSLPNSPACPGHTELQHSLSVYPATPSNFVSPGNLLRVYSVPSSRSLRHTSKRTGLSTKLRGTQRSQHCRRILTFRHRTEDRWFLYSQCFLIFKKLLSRKWLHILLSIFDSFLLRQRNLHQHLAYSGLSWVMSNIASAVFFPHVMTFRNRTGATWAKIYATHLSRKYVCTHFTAYIQ